MIGVFEVTGKAELTAKKRSERRRTKILGLGDEASYLVGTDLGARASAAAKPVDRVGPMKKRRFSSAASADFARERN
jgi:hypothetical protein